MDSKYAEELINYIDDALNRSSSSTQVMNERGEYLTADVGYVYEWWNDCMKPELERVFLHKEMN